jgi:hypothetical protein
MGLKPTCGEIHCLAPERLGRALSLAERVRGHMHLPVCAACRNLGRQLRLIRRMMRSLTVPDESGRNQD